MEYIYLTKPDGNIVSCVLGVPGDAGIDEAPKGVVIVIHGFTSSKECPTYEMLLRRLPAAGLVMVGIELPGHGSDTSYKEELRLAGCMDSIAAAEKYAEDNWPELPVYYFGSSFGAYVTGLYISTREHTGRKAFFRSGAVNMRALFVKDDPTEQEQKWLDALHEKGYFETGMELGNPVRITLGMYNDFDENDLFEKFAPDRFGDNKVMMAHGEDDDVIDPAEAKRFAKEFGVPIALFPGEGHSLSNDPGTPDRVADLAIEFFEK